MTVPNSNEKYGIFYIDFNATLIQNLICREATVEKIDDSISFYYV